MEKSLFFEFKYHDKQTLWTLGRVRGAKSFKKERKLIMRFAL